MMIFLFPLPMRGGADDQQGAGNRAGADDVRGAVYDSIANHHGGRSASIQIQALMAAEFEHDFCQPIKTDSVAVITTTRTRKRLSRV